MKLTSVAHDSGPQLLLQTFDSSKNEEFLLVEIVLFAKNTLKALINVPTFDYDVVVLENVLYSKPQRNKSDATARDRRLSGEPSLGLEERDAPNNSLSLFRTWWIT